MPLKSEHPTDAIWLSVYFLPVVLQEGNITGRSRRIPTCDQSAPMTSHHGLPLVQADSCP